MSSPMAMDDQREMRPRVRSSERRWYFPLVMAIVEVMRVMNAMLIVAMVFIGDGFETCRCLGRMQSRSEGEDGWQFVDQVFKISIFVNQVFSQFTFCQPGFLIIVHFCWPGFHNFLFCRPGFLKIYILSTRFSHNFNFCQPGFLIIFHFCQPGFLIIYILSTRLS